MNPTDWCEAGLVDLDKRQLRRRPPSFSSAPAADALVDGQPVLQFSSNNYLGLASDPRLVTAACEATKKWGTGAVSSRLVSGTLDIHLTLESALARLTQCESAALFSSGYLANVAAITTAVGAGDAIFSDELNHASVIDGCRLSGAEVAVYPHLDTGHLEQALKASTACRRLVVTDSVFSMTGDLADLAVISRICREHNAMLMVDEAHAAGLLGVSGAGGLEAAGLAGRADIVTGTLSKALGAAGGFVAARAPVIEWIRNKARTYIFDTAPPAGPVAAALAAVEIIAAEPERRTNALRLARRLATGLAEAGFACPEPAAAIVPVLVGEPGPTMKMSQNLLRQGVFAQAIRPPSVPNHECRIRMCVMATHTESQIDRVVAAFKQARS